MNLKKLTRIILIAAVLLLLSIVPVNAVVFNAAFDSDFYVNCYPDLKAAFGNDANAAYNHYLTYGIKEGRIASPVFDVKTYIRNYPDLQAAFGDDYVAAYNHFLTNGMNEGRLASDSFNVQVYIANYPDLQAAFGNDVAGAYNHYLTNGMAEGRVCGALEAGATAPEDHVHDFKLTEMISAATCINDGEGIYTCECGETEVREIPASAEYHDYQSAGKVGDITVWQCTICGDTYSEVPEGSVHEHEYVEIEGTTPATCTSEGKSFKQCTTCGDIIEEVIPMIDHVSSTPVGAGKIVAGVTSCVEDGAEEVTCDVCRQVFTRTIPAHNFVVVSSTEATCTAEGVTTYKCSRCEATKVEVAEKIAHSYGDVEDASTAATCTKAGIAVRVCSVCGDVKTETTPATGHDEADTTDPSYELGYAVLNAKGEITSITDATEADCTHDLIERYTCHCGVTVTNTIAKKLGHRIDTTKTVKEGIIKITGEDPEGNNIYETDEDGYVVTTGNVDCTHARVKVYTCANENCPTLEEVLVVIENATEHTPLAGSTVVYGADCGNPGYKTYTCTTCNQKITEATGEKALGHNYVFVAKTCTAKAHVACSRGCEVDTTAEDYTAFVDTLTAEQKAALADKTAPAHTLIGETRVNADGETEQYCKVCGLWVVEGAGEDESEQVDKSALTAALATVPENNDDNTYTDDSWATFETEIATAKAMPETTAEEVAAKVSAINTAVGKLVEVN